MTTETIPATQLTPEEIIISTEPLVKELESFLPGAELANAGELGRAGKQAEYALAELAVRDELAEPRRLEAIANFPQLAEEINDLIELLPRMDLTLLGYADQYSGGRLVVDYARTDTEEKIYGHFNDRGEMVPVSREDIPIANTTVTIFDRLTRYGVSFSSEHRSDSRSYGPAATRSEKAALVYPDGTRTQYYRLNSVEGTELLAQTGLNSVVEQLYGSEGLIPAAHTELLSREPQKESQYLESWRGHMI